MSAALAGWVRVGRVVGLFTFRAVHQTGGPRAGIDVIGFTTLIAIEERWGGRRRVDCDIVATKLIGREGIEVGGALGDFPESYVVYVERAGAASAWRGEADAELREVFARGSGRAMPDLRPGLVINALGNIEPSRDTRKLA